MLMRSSDPFGLHQGSHEDLVGILVDSLRRSDCFHVGSSRKLERKRNRKDGSNFRVIPRSKTLATQKQKVLLLKFFANRNFKSFQGLLVNRYKYEYFRKRCIDRELLRPSWNCTRYCFITFIGVPILLLSIFLRKSKEVPAYLAFFRCTPPP